MAVVSCALLPVEETGAGWIHEGTPLAISRLVLTPPTKRTQELSELAHFQSVDHDYDVQELNVKGRPNGDLFTVKVGE
eukprot:scaffold215902_cov31-Tisochrysis_lutea.AAC.2